MPSMMPSRMTLIRSVTGSRAPGGSQAAARRKPHSLRGMTVAAVARPSERWRTARRLGNLGCGSTGALAGTTSTIGSNSHPAEPASFQQGACHQDATLSRPPRVSSIPLLDGASGRRPAPTWGGRIKRTQVSLRLLTGASQAETEWACCRFAGQRPGLKRSWAPKRPTIVLRAVQFSDRSSCSSDSLAG